MRGPTMSVPGHPHGVLTWFSATSCAALLWASRITLTLFATFMSKISILLSEPQQMHKSNGCRKEDVVLPARAMPCSQHQIDARATPSTDKLTTKIKHVQREALTTKI